MLVISVPFDVNHIAGLMAIHFKQTNPNKQPRGQFIDLVQKYIDAVKQQAITGILLATGDQLEQNQIPLDLVKLRADCGKYGVPQRYWYDWFVQHAPLFYIEKKGNNLTGKRTMVKLAMDIDLDILVADSNPKDLFETIYKDYYEDIFNPNVVDWVPIDMRSLKAYLDDNRSRQAVANSDMLIKLKSNHKEANLIYKIAQFTQQMKQVDNRVIVGLPQIIVESPFGRKYYRGPNLQNVSKEVRKAALGRSHQYDINASVFAWKLTVVRELAPELDTTYTLEYLDYKDAIRRKLAKVLFADKNYKLDSKLKYVKQIMTAIGFGATGATATAWKTENGTWKKSALNEIIKSREELNNFLADPWMTNFLKEQIAINNKIFEWAKINCDLSHPGLYSDRGGLRKNAVISMLYQQSERNIIEQCMDIAGRDNVLLLCHDAIYTRYPVKLVELKSKLREFSNYTTIDHEEIRAWAYDDTSEHYSRMKEQELKALEWARSRGVPVETTEEQIERKYNQSLVKHHRRMSEDYSTEDGRDFDNGTRLYTRYDPELDPFFDEEID